MAISYDSVEILATFAQEHQISFPLLSDVGSAVIVELGLLNPHVKRQHDETNELHEKRFEGVPYPAAFLLDNNGIVIDRRFHADYRIRESADALVRGFLSIEDRAPEVMSSGGVVEVGVEAESRWFSPFQKLWFRAVLRVGPGWHLYASPAPVGLQGLTVVLKQCPNFDSNSISFRPPARRKAVAGSAGNALVYEGEVECRFPLVMSDNADVVSIEGAVEYQACSAVECMPPDHVDWTVDLHRRSF